MCYMAFTLKLKKIPLARHSPSVPLSTYLPIHSFMIKKKKKGKNSGFLITAKAVLVYVCEKGRVIVIFLMDRIIQYSLFVFLIEEKR